MTFILKRERSNPDSDYVVNHKGAPGAHSKSAVALNAGLFVHLLGTAIDLETTSSSWSWPIRHVCHRVTETGTR